MVEVFQGIRKIPLISISQVENIADDYQQQGLIGSLHFSRTILRVSAKFYSCLQSKGVSHFVDFALSWEWASELTVGSLKDFTRSLKFVRDEIGVDVVYDAVNEFLKCF